MLEIAHAIKSHKDVMYAMGFFHIFDVSAE